LYRIDDLRDHVAAALAEGQSANEVLGALGPPGDIADEAYASGPMRRAWRPRLRYALVLAAVLVVLVVLVGGTTAGFELTGGTAPSTREMSRPSSPCMSRTRTLRVRRLRWRRRAVVRRRG